MQVIPFSGMTPPRILIADPNPDTGPFLQSCLVRAGYSVPVVAASGREALDRGVPCAPDLALVSAALPGDPDGFETARLLRRSLQIPVLFLAPEGGDFSLNRARVPLGTGYLVGQLSEDELLAAVSTALGQASSKSAQERQHRTLELTLEALQDGVIATDLAGLITYVNPRAAGLLALPREEILGRPLAPLLEAARLDSAPSSVPLEQADGSISGSIHLLRQGDPDKPSACQPAIDFAESISDPLITIGPEDRVIHLNESAASLLGAPAAEILGASLWDHLPASAFAQHATDLRAAFQDKRPHTFQLYLETANTWWQARTFPFAGQLLLLLQDITGEKRAAAEAERVSRLEALSHLARGFTHDFNNLLTILMGNLALARAQAGSGGLQRLLDESEAATRRARDLVEQLTTFAKGGAPIKGMIPLRPILMEVLGRRPASSRIAYHTELEGTEFTLEADPKQLRRLLENLILNAEQAISGTGDVRIRCFRDEAPGEAASWLVIEVRDSGCGMPEETRTRAFEPFFTTRAQMNATGLGLTVCDSIARAHAGSLSLESQPGEGTVAQVRLPLHPVEQTSPSGPGSLRAGSLNGRRPPPRGSGDGLRRILVLEDETLIRRLICSTLTQAGFQVDETWDGHQTVEAFRLAREKGQPYDLLIMDLAIENGMGGVEAMQRIRNLDPAALAIVSSGYSDAPAMARPREFGFSSVLPKPYQPRHLIEAVEQILAERSSVSAGDAGMSVHP